LCAAALAASASPVTAQRQEPVPLRQQAAAPAAVSPTPSNETAPPSAAANKPATSPTTPSEIVLNFQAADLQAVVKAISQMTGRNFLLDPRLKGQITIISAKPVSAAAAYQIFISALKAQGFAAVEGPGNLVKIIPTGEARQHAPVSVQEPNGGEQVVTHVVILSYASATQMVAVLRPLMAPTSQLVAYDPSNALILTDYADNVRRMLRIIEKIDAPVSNDVNVISLQHASALDIAEMVARLSLPGISQPGMPGAPVPGVGASGDRFSIVPDMRTNSLLVRADNPGRVNQLRSLIAKLDVPATTEGTTRVIYIRNGNAVKLAEVLRGLLTNDRTQTGAGPLGSVTPPGARAAVARISNEQTSQIQADEATNALVINASDAVYNNLRAVIEKLDVRRAQVYVEALIVEMTQDNAMQLGIQWAGVTDRGVGGLQNFPSARPGIFAAAADPTTLANSGGLTVAYLGRSVTLPDGSVVRSLGALARALEEGSMANILSTPNLITLDNAEAKIIVGQNVPFITGSFAQATGTSTTGSPVNPFQTIERKDVGLTLKIKPQISEGGSIKLDLFQEVSSISPTSVSGASDLITNKRAIETKVAIDDGDTIVLGGLIEDTQNQSEQAVPILGRIPLLGALFRYRSTQTRKTNLMVFLRPVVIRTPDDGFRLTSDRYEYLRAQTKTKPQEEALDRIAPRRPSPQKDGLLGPPNAPEEFGK
jgi:general secretion pathway protein D